MGHRHLFNSSQILEIDNDEGQNHSEHTYVQFARAGASEGSNFVYPPPQNTVIDGRNLALQLNHPPSSEYPQYHPQPQPQYQPQPQHQYPQQTYDPFLHTSASGSQNGGQTFHARTDGMYKRKRHEFPGVYHPGSTSRYFDTGSSSSYGSHGLTFHNEDTHRNVRSRASFDYQGNSAITHFSPNPAHSGPIDHSSMSNLWPQAPNMNHGLVSPAPHGRAFVSGENSNHSAAMEFGGYHADYSFHHNPPSQAVRGIRSTHHQRYAPGVRPLHSGNVVASEEGLPMFSPGYSGRHSRSHSTSVHRDRGGRPRMTVDRYRALPDAFVHSHLTPEGVVIVSRTLFDQHQDMRLDIDNMTYEELLALEESMGNVNTGVSEDQISKCLTESIYCSSDEPQEDEDEEKCIICLEEYKYMDDVGSLKLCGHDFHVECIRKWLAVKNVCPICKSCALDDKIKNN